MSAKVLLALADCCEREQPSRELDVEIYLATAFVGPGGTPRISRYTTSIDAAATLTDWLILEMSDIAADGLGYVRLGDPGPTPPLEAVGCGSTHRAMNFCAAALRARAATERAG